MTEPMDREIRHPMVYRPEDKTMSRRKFLKRTAVVAGAAIGAIIIGPEIKKAWENLQNSDKRRPDEICSNGDITVKKGVVVRNNTSTTSNEIPWRQISAIIDGKGRKVSIKNIEEFIVTHALITKGEDPDYGGLERSGNWLTLDVVIDDKVLEPEVKRSYIFVGKQTKEFVTKSDDLTYSTLSIDQDGKYCTVDQKGNILLASDQLNQITPLAPAP